MLRNLLTALLLLAVPVAGLSACGGDESDKPPIQLQEQDREQIAEVARDYVTALHEQDVARALALLPEGVPEATVSKAIGTVRDQGLDLVQLGEIAANSEGATVTLQLTDKDGKAVTRTLELRLDEGTWRIWSPQLKPPV